MSAKKGAKGMNEENLFRVLEHFLREFDGEVRGREAAEVPAEILERIHVLAEGRANDKERNSLVEELAENPEWIGMLAEAVKRRRQD